MIDAATTKPSPSIDSDHPRIRDFARRYADGLEPVQAAVALYREVRDRIRYSPYNVVFEPKDYRASVVLARDPAEGHCIDKAVLLAAACRSLGIPARLHFANVRNHIGTEALEAKLGTDLLVFHGYTELFLDRRWVAATPAFNAALCRKLGVAPLEFDGVHDSVFQEYDVQAGRFMEYVTDHGVHTDIPFEAMFAEWRLHYPVLRDGRWPSVLKELRRPACEPSAGS